MAPRTAPLIAIVFLFAIGGCARVLGLDDVHYDDGGAAKNATDANATDASRPSYASVVLKDKPIVYYRLGESRGSMDASAVAVDLAGEFNATYGPLVSIPAPGLLTKDTDTAALFDPNNGDAGIVTTPRDMGLEKMDAISIECWVNFSSYDSNAGVTIVNYGPNRAYPFQPYALQVKQGQLQLYIVTNSSGGSIAPSMGTPYLVGGRTYHFVATYDSGGVSVLYVNGQATYTQKVNGLINNYGMNIGLTIGGNFDGTASPSGTIDEVSIYGFPLSAMQVEAHYIAGGGM
jgi:hypothetical protein